MCALYVVTAGKGGILFFFMGLAPSSTSCAPLSSPPVPGTGDVLRLGDRLDGRGVPDSLAGINERTPVGRRIIKFNSPGELAKRVTERSRGTIKMRKSVGNLIGRDGGRRDLRAAWRATED